MTAIGATAVVVTAEMTLNSERSLISDLPSLSDDPCYLEFCCTSCSALLISHLFSKINLVSFTTVDYPY